jgi:UDP-GlcNAc:undecaprenyl-phosphate GlcNAc-1-phosphate transferase
VIDEPDNARKVHKSPIAYLGGVAMFLGWLCGLVVSQKLVLHRIQPGWPTGQPIVKFSIVAGAIVIVVLGLWDDVRRVSPRVKIAGQTLAALFLLWDGVGVDVTRPLLSPLAGKLGHPYLFGEWFVYASSAIVVIGIVVACCNASNLMDGLDGLCGGVTAIIALAFVPFNFNPASIFMGDTGSMLLGFTCGVMIIMMGEERTKWLLAAMVVFALPILDTTLAFVRRWVNGRPVFSADKQHFHHQLVARGFSVKRTVLISYGLALMFMFLGVGMVFIRTRYAIAFYLVIFGSVIVAAFKMGMVHERPHGGPAQGLDAPGTATSTATIEADTVFEIPDSREAAAPDERLDGGKAAFSS